MHERQPRAVAHRHVDHHQVGRSLSDQSQPFGEVARDLEGVTRGFDDSRQQRLSGDVVDDGHDAQHQVRRDRTAFVHRRTSPRNTRFAGPSSQVLSDSETSIRERPPGQVDAHRFTKRCPAAHGGGHGASDCTRATGLCAAHAAFPNHDAEPVGRESLDELDVAAARDRGGHQRCPLVDGR